MSAAEITNLSLQRGVMSVVDVPVDIPVELLNSPMWEDYAEERQLSRPIDSALMHLGLSEKNQEGKWLPKYRILAWISLCRHLCKEN